MAKSGGYVLAILAGILALMALLFPVAYEDVTGFEIYVWMWTLILFKTGGGDWESEFIDSDLYEDIFLWGLVGTALIFISFVLLIYTGVKANKRNENYSAVWIMCSIFLVFAPVMFIITTSDENFWFGGFWDWLDPHFGIISPFIAALLAFVAGLMGR